MSEAQLHTSSILFDIITCENEIEDIIGIGYGGKRVFPRGCVNGAWGDTDGTLQMTALLN